MDSFVNNTTMDAAKAAQLKDFEIDYTSQDVKMPAINLFLELGRLVDKQLKDKITDKRKKNNSGNSASSEYKESPLEKHLLVDDVTIGAMSKSM